MNGAGNDFIVFNQNEINELSFNSEAVRKLCHRRFGIGADGIICVGKNSKHDFTMRYYNADGFEGSLCGNGARCAILFAMKENFFSGQATSFSVKEIVYSGRVRGEDSIEFFLNNPGKMKFNFKIKAASQLINSHFVDTGSPHVVIFINEVLENPKNFQSGYKEINSFPVENLGSEIRHHKDFSPSGANVNFIQKREDEILIRTFERGVEAETLACGTGSVAAAITAYKILNVQPPIKIKTLGGKTLMVNFNHSKNDFTNVSLTGHAEINFKGEIIINNYFN